MRNFFLIISFWFFISLINAQEKELIVTGNLLKGGKIGNENIQEWLDNVTLIQEDVKITCDRAIRYLQSNEVELFGNVVAKQDTITILSKYVRYFGNEKYIFADSSVILEDGHIVLSSKKGYYYFDTETAFFYNDVILFNQERRLTSNKLHYYHKNSKAVAVGNVSIADSASAIYADSLINFTTERISYAYNNVKIVYPPEKVTISGKYLEDFHKKNYTKIIGLPLLTKIDTSQNGVLDTLLIGAKMFEAIKDTTQKLIATDTVKIVRNNFSSYNQKTIFFREEERIFICKNKKDTAPPLLWHNSSQLFGDTINVFIKNNELNEIDVIKNGFFFSLDTNYQNRYNQIMGDTLKFYFKNQATDKTEVKGNVLSIYYYGNLNGLIKASAESAKIYFQNNLVSDINFYTMAITEYHPENLIKGNELDFTLPLFKIYKNKPTKEELLKRKNK